MYPPSKFLNDCPVATPPTEAEFVSLPLDLQLTTLGIYGMDQTTALGQCNADKQGLRDWVRAAKARYGVGKG